MLQLLRLHAQTRQYLLLLLSFYAIRVSSNKHHYEIKGWKGEVDTLVVLLFNVGSVLGTCLFHRGENILSGLHFALAVFFPVEEPVPDEFFGHLLQRYEFLARSVILLESDDEE